MNNKFLSIAASTAIVASALVFTGCGSDSSSTTTAAPAATTASGTLTATALKGAWSGLNYTVTANGTGVNSTAAMTDGKVSFNRGDNVTVDMGAALWKLSGITTNNTVASFAQVGTDGVGTLLKTTGVAYTAAESANVRDNLLAVVAMMNNNSAAVETAGFNAASIIANLRTLSGQGLDLTTAAGSAAFISGLTANFSTTAMSNKNVTDATSAVTTYGPALKAAAQATFGAAVASSAASSSNSLNTSLINGTFIYLKNTTGTYVLDAADMRGAVNTTGNMGLSNMNATAKWNASGSVIKIGGTNVSELSKDYLVFGGAIDTTGVTATPVTYVDNNGIAYKYTLSGIKANLSNFTSLLAAGDTKNITFTSQGISVVKAMFNSTGAHRAEMNYSNGTSVGLADGSTQSAGSYKNLTDSYGLPTILALYSDNTFGTGFLNVSFDYNPQSTASTGVVATIVNAVDSWITAMKTFFLGLFQK